jgi:hypothetical protein
MPVFDRMCPVLYEFVWSPVLDFSIYMMGMILSANSWWRTCGKGNGSDLDALMHIIRM